MPPPGILICSYLLVAGLVAHLATTRGRSTAKWFVLAVVLTPLVALLALWFLRDLAHERRQTHEFLALAKQRRHRRDPNDAFTRTRERHEQEIQTKVITARRERQRAAEALPTTRRLRSLEQRTPITAIMQM
jgi:hypothetical protein